MTVLKPPRVERVNGFLCARSRRPRCEALADWLCLSCGWSQPADEDQEDALALFGGPGDHSEEECHRRQIERARHSGLDDPTTDVEE